MLEFAEPIGCCRLPLCREKLTSFHGLSVCVEHRDRYSCSAEFCVFVLVFVLLYRLIWDSNCI